MLSIIMATYNQENYVLDTLNSMLKSDVHDVELIVTDDCSTDRTPEVVEDWVDKNGHRFANAKLIKGSENVGIVGNFRKGIVASKGSLLKGLAGDDWFLPKAIDIIKKYDGIKSTIFCSDVVEINELTGKRNIRRNDRRFFMAMTSHERANFLAGVGCVILAPGAFYSRDVWDDSAHLLRGIKHIEDYYLWFCSAKKGKLFVEVGFPSVCYRTHNDNISMCVKDKPSRLRSEFLIDKINVNLLFLRDSSLSVGIRYSCFIRSLALFVFLKSSTVVGKSVAIWPFRLLMSMDPYYMKKIVFRLKSW